MGVVAILEKIKVLRRSAQAFTSVIFCFLMIIFQCLESSKMWVLIFVNLILLISLKAAHLAFFQNKVIHSHSFQA